MSVFVYDGKDLSLYGVRYLSGPWFAAPSALDGERAIGRQDGMVASPRVYRGRIVRLPVVISGTSWSSLLSRIDSVHSTLNTREDVAFSFDTITDRYWNGRGRLSSLEIENPQRAIGEIELMCADPFAYASSESTHEETGVSTGAEGDSFTVTVAGTMRAYPEIVFESTGSSTPLTIEHDAQDTRLTYTGAMASGDKIRVKCAPTEWAVERMPSGEDAYASVMPYVDGQWPYLAVGDNIFTVYWFDGDITWTWRERYL